MGLGDWFNKNILGSSNENTAEKPAVDSNAYNYGGYEGGATDAAMRYRENARNAQGREGVNANYDSANRMNNMGLAARGDMNQVGQAQLARALGKVPSIAQMQADRQMGQASAQQAALAASARGRGGLANAATTAANNTANVHGAISGQAQVNAAQERMAAEQAAAGTFGNMQQLDAARTGMAGQMAQYNATNQMQQRELNDRMTMDQLKNEMGVQGMQLGASQNLQAQKSANSLGAAGINAGVGGQNAGMAQQSGLGLIGLGGQIAGGFATGGGSGSVTGKADGGPVEQGTPYLVGERGPELIVPKKDAMVIPAGQTAGLLSRAMGQDRSQMRDGPSDQRTYNMEKSFHRDTPQDQARVKRQVEDQASREADAMMAGYMAALKQGPTLRRAEDGTPESNYETQLTLGAEEAFKNQRQQLYGDDTGEDYDLRGAFAAGQGRDGRGHMTDQFKKPNHETFSDESQYAKYGQPGHWVGEKYIAARADGGPLAQGQPGLVGEQGPELVVPQMATWGRGTSVEGVGETTRDQYANEVSRVQAEANEAAKVESPWERDVRRHKALTSMGDREGAAMVAPGAQRSRAILRGAKQAQGSAPEAEAKEDPSEKQAVAEGKKAPPTLRSRLNGAVGSVSDGATKLANAVDTRYHGPTGGFGGPQLIPVMAPPRAMGGPMMAGMPYSVGERGPEMVMPMGGASMSQPGGPTQLSGGGMDVLGSLKAHSNFATKFQSDPTGGMVAREEGGPVAQGQTALVGEKGPEMVVPQVSLLSRLGDSLRSAIGMSPQTTAPPAEPRQPRYAEVSSGAPLGTKTDDPGTSRVTLAVGSHGYFPEKAQRMAKDQEMTHPSAARQAETRMLQRAEEEDEAEKKRKAQGPRK